MQRITKSVLPCVPWILQGSRPVYTGKRESCKSWTVWPQHWTTHVVCCPMAIQASGLKKGKWWLTSMKIREHCLSQGKRKNFIQGSARESSPLTKTAYQLPRLRHTDWSCCEFWIKKIFPPFMPHHNQKLLVFTIAARTVKMLTKMLLSSSSNCSLRPPPYSQDCILKKGRKERGK